jgi:hypothetical protein
MNNNKSISTFCIILLVQGISILSAEERAYNTKPFAFVAAEIQKGKIVMLGENGAIDHSNLFPHITFINIIKSWNYEAKGKNIHNKTLTLIIEKSPSVIKLIQHYIDTDDLDPFLISHGDMYSLEDLYLYFRLKELNKEIKESNNKLNIVGFEIDERYEDEYFFKKTAEERNIFFGRVRDSLLYENINTYVLNNPNDNILIYYGGAHLVEEFIQKTAASKTYDGKGYYLAYYLRKEFKNRLVTVDQSFIEENYNYKNDLTYLKNNNFLIEKEDSLFSDKIPFVYKKAYYIIVKHDGLVGPHFIRNVFSRNSLIRDYDKLKEFELIGRKYNQTFSLKLSEVKNPLVSLTLESIKLITGQEFDSIKDYKSFLDTTENKILHNRILNIEFSNELLSYLKDNPPFQNYRFMLYCLGLTSSIVWSQGTPPEEVWKNDLWKNALPHMNYFDYVGLFWFGNSSEKERAKKFLLDFTHKDFAEAANYLEWYYKNKFNYNFDMN